MNSWKETEVSIPNQGEKKGMGKEEPKGKRIEKEIVKMDRTEEVKKKDYFQFRRV